MTKATYKRKHLIWWWFQRVHDGRVKGRSRAHSLIHKHEAEKEKSLESIETSKTFSQWRPSPNKATLLNASQTVLPSGDRYHSSHHCWNLDNFSPVSSQLPVHQKEVHACPSELEERKSFLCCDTVSYSPKRSKAAAAFSLSTLQMWLRHLSTGTWVKLAAVSTQDFLLGLNGKKNMFRPSKQSRLWLHLVISLPQWLRDLGAPKDMSISFAYSAWRVQSPLSNRGSWGPG